MIDRIYDYMLHNRMIVQGSCILVAVSGGADSMCLLEVLRELRDRAGLRLKVLHVHHGLRESAEGDLLYVSKYCEAAGIPFTAVRVDAAGYAAEKGLSVEEAARHLRYKALSEAAEIWDSERAAERPSTEASTERPSTESSTKRPSTESATSCRIAVAHHIEDQAETVLFNLVRGSRLTGLRGMLPVNGRIIRPLLECSRSQIEEFLRERNISWREDETNEDVRYARNLLRREVMPLLGQINARATEHIAKAAEEAAETEAFLAEATEKALSASCSKEENLYILSIPPLIQQPLLIQRRVVYAVIAKAAGRKKDLLDVHVRDVLQLAQKIGNGQLDVFGSVHVEKVYDKLIFSGGEDGKAGSGSDALQSARASALNFRRWPMEAGEYSCRVFDFDGDLSTVSRKQYTKWLDYDKIGAFPSFRTRREGDRITLDESGRSKTIARYMIDAKVPAELRGRIILPTAGSEILWMPAARPAETSTSMPAGPAEKAEAQRTSDSGRISAAFMVSGSTRRILEIRWDPAQQQDPAQGPGKQH